MGIDHDSLEDLQVRAEIHDVLMRWCRAVDRGDDELLAAVFHADAEGPRTFLSFSGEDLPTTHFAGNELVHVLGDTAHSELYVVAWRRQHDDAQVTDLVVGGRVLDVFERRDGEWRIAHRRVLHDWRRFDPVVAEWPPNHVGEPPVLTWGRRSRADASYRAPGHRDRLAAGSPRGREPVDALQVLLDRAAIHDTLMRYCRGADRLDGDLVETVYHPDAYDDHGFVQSDGAGMVAAVRAKADGTGPDPYLQSTHFVGNELVEVDGDWASAEQTFVLRQRIVVDGVTGDSTMAGRYVDELERRDGAWRLIDRRLVFDWMRYDPLGERWPPRLAVQPPSLTWGERSTEDIVYRPPTWGGALLGSGLPVSAAADPEAALQALRDRQAVRDVLLRYCRGADRGDPEIIDGVYYPEAEDDHGFYRTDGAGMVEGARRARGNIGAPGQQQKTMHLGGNTLICVEGDRATAELYFVAFHRYEDGPDTDFVLAGRYLDELERRDGEWRLSERRLVYDWGRHDVVLDRWPDDLRVDPPGVAWGRRSREDAVYHWPAAT